MARARATRWMFTAAAVCGVIANLPAPVRAQQPDTSQAPPARSRDGKRLFGAADAVRVQRVFAPRLSPDGSHVAYLVSALQTEKDKPGKVVTQLWVVPTAGPATAARQFTRGDRSVSNAQWSPDGTMLAFITTASDDKDAKPQVWFMYAAGGAPWQVTTHRSGVRDFELSPDGRTLLLVATNAPDSDEERRTKLQDDAMVVDHDFKMTNVFMWDVASGKESSIATGDGAASDAHWSPDGARIAYTEAPTPRLDDRNLQSVWVVTVASGERHKVNQSADPASSARWSPDGKWIAYLSSHGGEPHQTHLFVASADAGAATPRKLTSTFALNAGEPHWAPDGTTIYFATDTRESGEIFAADVAAGTVRQVTTAPGVMSIDDVSRDGRTMIGTRTDPTHPADVYRADVSFASPAAITNQNAWLAGYALGATEVIQWKSGRDGMTIDGIVTRPVDFAVGRRYPFLLNPHGGPTASSLLSFNAEEQVMAANGYLVLEPNFRGSTGRGEAFAAANENDWGRGDYQDDMSGVDAVIARGWADADRLGAFGWSYGGFMTFWIDTQTDRFKAISPGAGLPDLYSMYAQTDIHSYLGAFFGHKPPWDSFETYWDHSPMKYVTNVKTPTMILHGQADTRVPIPQAEEFYRALSERHVPVEFVTYPRENHGFVEPRHIEDRLQRYLVFFGKYLHNPPVTEPAAVVQRMEKALPSDQVAQANP